jgi:hypothetical protein
MGIPGPGDQESVLAVVPVKPSKGNMVIQTYAFLDPRSTATFCIETDDTFWHHRKRS